MMYCYFHWMGNGVCEPECNNEHNFYDMGDCCLPTAVTGPDRFCEDNENRNISWGNHFANCSCHVTNTSNDLANMIGCRHSHLVYNAQCNDVSNSPECHYDGGDCCRRAINQRCYYCVCHSTGKKHTYGIFDSFINSMASNRGQFGTEYVGIYFWSVTHGQTWFEEMVT